MSAGFPLRKGAFRGLQCEGVTSGVLLLIRHFAFQCDCAWVFFLFCVCLFTLSWLYLALVTLNDFHLLNE